MQEVRRTIGSEPVRWTEHGSGHPVVLVHGVPTSPRLWRHVLPLVGGHSHALEMRGYGTSIPDAGSGDLGLAAQADRLLRWVEAVGLQRPLLVGHDLGGGVAQIAAVRSPGTFGGIVLTNSVCYDSWPIPSVRAMRPMARLLRHLPEAAVYAGISQLVHRGHDDHGCALEALGVHWPPYVTHGAARALMRQVAALRTQDTVAVADGLPSLHLPARVVWGDADQFQEVRYGERLAADLGTDLRRIRGGRHFTPEDHPAAVADAVNDLLRDMDAA